jgi:cell fate regulator YaaT (PSP1 superfamily)
MEICDVEFKGRRKAQYQNPQDIPVQTGNWAVVAAERGEHLGRITRIFEATEFDAEIPIILRLGTAEDYEQTIKNGLREKEAFRICKEKIMERDLPMKLVDVEYQFDGNKISFYFTSDQRIDFRELVRSLAAVYHTRIDMRQIGARDEAKRMCSIGSCGRPLCCGLFLDTFKAVTTEAVEHQHLSLAPSKLLGACGRLKCCLLYEEGYYEEAGKRFPKVGARIATDSGPCEVIKIDVVGDAILVKYESGVVERVPRARLGSGDCDGKKCRHAEPAHAVDALVQE